MFYQHVLPSRAGISHILFMLYVLALTSSLLVFSLFFCFGLFSPLSSLLSTSRALLHICTHASKVIKGPATERSLCAWAWLCWGRGCSLLGRQGERERGGSQRRATERETKGDLHRRPPAQQSRLTDPSLRPPPTPRPVDREGGGEGGRQSSSLEKLVLNKRRDLVRYTRLIFYLHIRTHTDTYVSFAIHEGSGQERSATGSDNYWKTAVRSLASVAGESPLL